MPSDAVGKGVMSRAVYWPSSSVCLFVWTDLITIMSYEWLEQSV